MYKITRHQRANRGGAWDEVRYEGAFPINAVANMTVDRWTVRELGRVTVAVAPNGLTMLRGERV